MAQLDGIRGLLLDLNGVFYVGNRLLPGALQLVEFLQAAGIPYRFATNNTTESLGTLSQALGRMGLAIAPEEIISAPYSAALHLRKQGYGRITPLLTQDVRQDFAEFQFSETDAEAVVVGDMAEEWSYRLLNQAFKQVRQGAELVALHRGKAWQWEGGLRLDVGAFVAGLEYATDTAATVVGKPATSFFELALADLGLPPYQVAVVGDSLTADISGAQQAGLMGILIQTGQYRSTDVASSSITPDLELESLTMLQRHLQQMLSAISS